MINKIFINAFFIILIALTSAVKAQDNKEALHPKTVTSLTKIRLTFLGLGLEREQKIGKLTTIYAGASMDAVFPFEPDYKPNRSDALSLASFIGFTPTFYSGIRKYYNLLPRAKESRKTINSAADYFGFEIDAIAPMNSEEGEFKTLWVMSFTPQLGLQRSLSKNTNIEFSVGPALKTNFETVKVFPFGRFGLSFLL